MQRNNSRSERPERQPDEPQELRVASMLEDTMADTLFRQEAPLSRLQDELRLRTRIVAYWEHLFAQAKRREITEREARKKLDALDIWASKKLSGENVLYLAVHAEREYPDWIMLMPRLLALRYEELRTARLWSALLNPRALSRLRAAIESERMFSELERT